MEDFTTWFEKNKEDLRNEYRCVKASTNFAGMDIIPNLRQWASNLFNGVNQFFLS